MSPTRVDGISNVVLISAGGMHSGCIDRMNRCYTWGSNGYGQLGILPSELEDGKYNSNGTEKISCVPRQVFCYSGGGPSSRVAGSPEPLLLSRLSCGGMHTGAIDLNGNIWCWGRADSGQVGYATKKLFFGGAVVSTPYAVSVTPKSRFKYLSCGAFHTVMISEEGQAYSMGKDDFGMLGTSPDTHSMLSAGYDTPTLIPSLSKQRMIRVSCGGWHTLFLSEEGEVFSCGKGEFGRLGVGSEKSHNEPSAVPLDASLPPGARARMISAGGSHSLLVTDQHQVYGCGRLDSGRLGYISPGELEDRIMNFGRIPLEKHLQDPQSQCCSPVTAGVGRGLGSGAGVGQLQVTDISAGGAHTLILLNPPREALHPEEREGVSTAQMPAYLFPGMTPAAGSPTRSRKNSNAMYSSFPTQLPPAVR